jgi:hypothetical protein
VTRNDYLEKVFQLEQEAFRIDQEGWLKHELFTWQWWLLVAFLILPWVLWGRIVNRRKLMAIVQVGLLTCIITVFLDVVGMKYGFWRYPFQLFPLTPRAIAFDMSMVPVAYMIIYQYFTTWRSFSISLIIMAVLFAFIGEPFSIWADLVEYMKWKYLYSFIFYIITGITVRWLVERMSALYVKD